MLLLKSSTKMRKEILEGSQNKIQTFFHNLYHDTWLCMKLYIKKKPVHKKTFHANENEDAQGVKVENDVPPVTCISSEDEIMDSGQPLPVSIFGSNRESKHLEYMAVSSRSPSNGSYLSKAGIEYHIDQTDEESSNELVISGGEDLKIASNQTSGKM